MHQKQHGPDQHWNWSSKTKYFCKANLLYVEPNLAGNRARFMQYNSYGFVAEKQPLQQGVMIICTGLGVQW